MQVFKDDALYFTNDKALHQTLGTSQDTLMRWRVSKRGPDFVRVGNRVGYVGKDLNSWLAQNHVKVNGKAKR